MLVVIYNDLMGEHHNGQLGSMWRVFNYNRFLITKQDVFSHEHLPRTVSVSSSSTRRLFIDGKGNCSLIEGEDVPLSVWRVLLHFLSLLPSAGKSMRTAATASVVDY